MTMRTIQRLAWTLTIVAAGLQLYTYTYPSLNPEKCYWAHEYRDLEGLSSWERSIVSLPYVGDLYKQYFTTDVATKGSGLFTKEEPRDIRLMAVGDPQLNGNWPSTPYWKRLDNFGNDYYLRHIYTLMKQRLDPTFVAIMGDLLSSQWLGDTEFYNRTRRIITRSFPRPKEQALTELEFVEKHENVDWRAYMDQFLDNMNNGVFKSRDFYEYKDVYEWNNDERFLNPESGLNTEPLFLNVTGNHDIGYGDTTFQHMARWLKLFGKVNYFIEYDSDTDHPWRIVMLDTLAVDGPMLQPQFQEYTWQFIETLKSIDYKGSTVLLTHIPMYKRAGLCMDGPNFEYYQESGCHGCSPDRVGLLKSQNHLSQESSQKILDAVFGGGNGGIILTGHDHHGCDNYYSFIDEEKGWVASKSIDSEKWIREITVRSIMGDYDGTIGIMTGHFNKTDNKWDFDYTHCKFGSQKILWGAHICTLLAILFHTLGIFC